MIRRAARERREFIYKKTIEQRQKAIEDKRERIKHALESTQTNNFSIKKQILIK
jgi:U3 small nucleolar ribonucleoprotein protein IMP4